MKARWLNSKLCATEKTYDYSNFREHPPRSILVLSQLNESTAVGGAYSLLSTVTCPLAEMGYYVYPVSVMDHFLKENGLPTAGEMHQIPLDKILEIIGADAVLYLTFQQYGTKYAVFFSVTTVAVEGKLGDTRTGQVLWEGKVRCQENPGGHPLVVAVLRVVSSSVDVSHEFCRTVSTNLFVTPNHGLLPGPYHPQTENQ